jgi:hypothetical protein
MCCEKTSSADFVIGDLVKCGADVIVMKVAMKASTDSFCAACG